MQEKSKEITRLLNNITVLQKNLDSPLCTIVSSEDARVIFGYQKGVIDMTDDILEEVKKFLKENHGA